MYFIVYKTTNTINGKFYIGKHQTNKIDDGYFGSGKLLKLAIQKYGKDCFVREIIKICETKEEMNLLEASLVVLTEDSYNLCPGGNGGWGYINETGIPKFKGKVYSKESIEKQLHTKRIRNKLKLSEETKRKISERNKLTNESRGRKVSEKLKGRTLTPEHKENLRKAMLKRHAEMA